MRHVTQMMAAPNREAFSEYISDNGFYETIGMGGSRFGNKTHTGAWCLGIRRLMYGNTRGLALRTVLRAADLNMGEEIKKAFLEPMGLPVGSVRKGEVQYLEKDKRFLFPNGSMLQLGFCLKANDWEQHQGLQWDDLWMEEATQFPEHVINKLSASVRPNNPKCPPRKLVTCNPGGIGAEWVERRIINPATRDRRCLWVRSSVKNNPIVLMRDPGYILRELNAIRDPVLRAQWLDGDWDAQSGIYFRLVPEIDGAPGTVQEVQVPYWADWYAGVDWGYDKPWACVWIAHWQDDADKHHIHVGGEVYQAGLDLDQQAEQALVKEKDLKRKFPFMHEVEARYADPMTSTAIERTSSEQTRSKASVWREYGFLTRPSRHYNRVSRWNLMRYLIRKRILTIDPDCRALLKEFKGAIRKENSEDLDQDKCPDHALDALAYVVCKVMGMDFVDEPQDDSRWDLKKVFA